MEMLDGMIEKAKKDQDVLAVILFGSYARGDQRADSDVDICLVLRPEVFDATKAFDKMLNLIFSESMDIAVFQQLPLYIRQRVLKDGKLLFCRDEDALYEIACRTITEYADYEHIYIDYLKEVERG